MYRVLSASKDTYITDKIINNNFRATDANVGFAGTLDLFKLYEESSYLSGTTRITGSVYELSRILIKFDLDPLRALTASSLDISHSSFKCLLKLHDVYGGQTTPSNFKLIVFPLSRSFDEGIGRDVVSYKDVDAANFLTASTSGDTVVAWAHSGANQQGLLKSDDIDIISSGSLPGIAGAAAATATIIGNASLDDASGTSLILVNADTSTVTFTTDPTLGFGDVTADTGDVAATATFVGTAGLDDASGTSLKLVNADDEIIIFTTNPAKNFGDTVDETASPFTVNTRDISGGSEVRKATQAFWISCKAAIDAGVLDMTISPTTWGDEEEFTLTQTTTGTAGNTAITLITGMTADGATDFAGGVGSRWRVNTRDISGGSEVRKATQTFWIACKGAIDAEELNMSISPTTWGDEEEFTLTQTTAGPDGNTAITLITGVTANGETRFTGGERRSPGVGNLWKSQTFTEGIEDLSIDVTQIVSGTIAGLIPDHGFRISYSGSQETDDRTRFVKRFASRHASETRLRPKLIVKYDDSIEDNHESFFFNISGSLFLNNFHRGQPKNLLTGTDGRLYGVSGSNCFILRIVSGSYSASITGSQHSIGSNFITGVYSASFLIDEFSVTGSLGKEIRNAGSATFKSYWESLDGTLGFYTGSFVGHAVNRTSFENVPPRLFINITNLRKSYLPTDFTTLRVFVENIEREIVAKKLPLETKSQIYTKMYYRVRDYEDDTIIVPFDTSTNSTKVSTDSKGMYFSFYMSSLSPGRTYIFDFLIKDQDSDLLFTDVAAKFRID